MRSRPDVEVALSPAVVRPGDILEVEVTLLGKTDTPIDMVSVELKSVERRYHAEKMERFARSCLELARLVDGALAALPAPARLEACRGAWQDEARKLSGTFCPGDFSIRGARYRDCHVELLTRFEGAEPVATLARLELAALPPEPLPAEAARVLASLSAEVAGVRIAADAVELPLPCPLPNPERAELSWRSLQRLALALEPAS